MLETFFLPYKICVRKLKQLFVPKLYPPKSQARKREGM